jgi:hypothetical protein
MVISGGGIEWLILKYIYKLKCCGYFDWLQVVYSMCISVLPM